MSAEPQTFESYKLSGFREFTEGTISEPQGPRYVVGGKWANEPGSAGRVREIDLKGSILVPRTVDAHVHVFPEGGPFGLDPQHRSLTQGTNLFVDGGSAGYENFARMRTYLDGVARGKYRAFVNLAPHGLTKGHTGELRDDPAIDLAQLRAVTQEHADVVCGLKVRLSQQLFSSRSSAYRYFDLALQQSRELQLPLMVHIMDSPIEIAEVLDQLGGRDVATHIYSDANSNVLQGRGLEAALDARTRGVRFDVGCGCGGFDFEVARVAFSEGLKPDYISSDVSTVSVDGPVVGLPHTMAKALNLGMTVEEVFAAVSVQPQELFVGGAQEPDGAAAFSVFAIEEGEYRYYNTGFLPQEVRVLNAAQSISDVLTFNYGRCSFGEGAYSKGVTLKCGSS